MTGTTGSTFGQTLYTTTKRELDMHIDYTGCLSADDQEILQALSRVWSHVFVSIWANFHAKEPYIIAYTKTGWQTFTVAEARKLADV